jgi:hypothetical protein
MTAGQSEDGIAISSAGTMMAGRSTSTAGGAIAAHYHARRVDLLVWLPVMTPDGISDADWTRVRDLAAAAVEASAGADEVLASQRLAELMRALDALEAQYGRRPSLLATRADFNADEGEKLVLLEEAYAIADESGDVANTVWIADALATLHIDDRRDPIEGARWLEVYAQALTAAGDDVDVQPFQALQERLRQLSAIG